MRRLLLFIVIMLIPCSAIAADEILRPDFSSALNAHVAGALTNDSSLEIRNLRVNPTTKRLIVDAIDASTTPVNGVVDIAAAGATSRTQLPANAVNYCTLQAGAAAVYVGGATVTNASGTNEGIKLEARDEFKPALRRHGCRRNRCEVFLQLRHPCGSRPSSRRF
jgi:hypothetical protein